MTKRELIIKKAQFESCLVELEGQVLFEEFLERELTKGYSTDGYTKGVLFEGKLNLGASYGLRRALKQAKNYATKLMEGGEYLPKYFCAYDINQMRAFVYEIELGVEEDEDGNEIGTNEISLKTVEDFNWFNDIEKLRAYVDKEETIKYNTTGYPAVIIGLAGHFYKSNPTANKVDFFDNHLTKDNDKFLKFEGTEGDLSAYMDVLNDPASQKVLGAFYTPDKYVKISTEYVRDAIQRIKDDGYEDYVILNRASGSGNLLKFLTVEELTHCVLNTYEAKEWLALTQNYSRPYYIEDGNHKYLIKSGVLKTQYNDDKIIIDVLVEDYFNNNEKSQYSGIMSIVSGTNLYNEIIKRNQKVVRDILPPTYDIEGTLIKGGNALEKDFYEQEIIKNIIENKDKCPIIMLENPPYADTGDTSGKANKKGKTSSYIREFLIENGLGKSGFCNDLSNQFIYSAFNLIGAKYYIVYSPVKYWKSNKIIDKKFIQGYLCDRQFFSATSSGILLAHWYNEDDDNSSLKVQSDIGEVVIKKVNAPAWKLFTKMENDDKEIAVMDATIFQLVYNHSILSDKHKSSDLHGGAGISKKTLLVNLPLWCAAQFYNMFTQYTEKEVLMKSSDGGTVYQQDSDFLNDCLIYSLLTNANKVSKTNELYPYGFSQFTQKSKHNKIMKLWDKIYTQSGTITDDKKPVYGLDNIMKECDVFTKGLKGERVYTYPDLHANIETLKKELKEFYIKHIKPKMLKYELVK